MVLVYVLTHSSIRPVHRWLEFIDERASSDNLDNKAPFANSNAVLLFLTLILLRYNLTILPFLCKRRSCSCSCSCPCPCSCSCSCPCPCLLLLVLDICNFCTYKGSCHIITLM